MIQVGCNLCRRIIGDDDADAVREGVGPKGRVDICGACMRETAARVGERLRTLAQRLDPTPPTIRERALSIQLPERLIREFKRKST